MANKNKRFDYCLIVINPSSSSFKRSDKLIASLDSAFLDKNITKFRVSKTELATPVRLRRELRKLDNKSLLAIIGGDGTVNAVVNELAALKEEAPKQAVLLPLWGGNACDLAHMANGRRRNSVREILRNGKVRPIFPLEYSLQTARKKVEGLALCYISFGAVAHAAKLLEDSKAIKHTKSLPGLRLLTEVGIGFRGLVKAERFEVKTASETGKLYDIVFVNGPRIAKLYRTPAKLTTKGFVELKVKHKYPLLITHVSKLTRLWVRGQKVNQRTLTLLHPTWMQYDGEVQALETKTVVRVQPARQSVSLLATK